MGKKSIAAVPKKEAVLVDFLSDLRAAKVETKFAIAESVLRLLHHTGVMVIQTRELLDGQISEDEIVSLAAHEVGYSLRYIRSAVKLIEFMPEVDKRPPGFEGKNISFNKLCDHFLGPEEKEGEAKEKCVCSACGNTHAKKQ